jgi:hypothetical protein
LLLILAFLNIELIKQEEKIMDTTSVNGLQKTMEYQNNTLQQKLVRVESNLDHKVDFVADKLNYSMRDLNRKIDENNRLLVQIKSKIEMAEWRRDLTWIKALTEH